MSGSDEHWEAYKTAANAQKAAINKAKQIFLNVTLPSMPCNSTKQFWSVVSGSKRAGIMLTGIDGVDILRDQCASVLNDSGGTDKWRFGGAFVAGNNRFWNRDFHSGSRQF